MTSWRRSSRYVMDQIAPPAVTVQAIPRPATPCLAPKGVVPSLTTQLACSYNSRLELFLSSGEIASIRFRGRRDPSRRADRPLLLCFLPFRLPRSS
ncbi:hypothetical protein E2C01_062827 [Portunus trituberculatus]|uniref:Uncharacterized protein n=1 Tax=Portunus trituberculatus TaxID=210409 RepID=A0A5B7HJ63_PORTR|nr:hypothetical protein [Portunus trituberculatus]